MIKSIIKFYAVCHLSCTWNVWTISKSTFYRYKKLYPFADIDVFSNGYVIHL